MNFIDKAKLRAFLYKLNCGLIFNNTINYTDFDNINALDLYSKNVDIEHDSKKYDLIITTEENTVLRHTFPDGLIIVINKTEEELTYKELL